MTDDQNPDDMDDVERSMDQADEVNGEGLAEHKSNDAESRYGDGESPA